MRNWAWMLSGLIVWTVHLFGGYAVASIADVVASAEAPIWRGVGLIFSLVCAAVAAGLAIFAVRLLRRPRAEAVGFRHEVALLSSLVALVAIVWQGLPFLMTA